MVELTWDFSWWPTVIITSARHAYIKDTVATLVLASRLSALEVFHTSCNMGTCKFAWNIFPKSEGAAWGLQEQGFDNKWPKWSILDVCCFNDGIPLGQLYCKLVTKQSWCWEKLKQKAWGHTHSHWVNGAPCFLIVWEYISGKLLVPMLQL